jgi:hypothetical protein
MRESVRGNRVATARKLAFFAIAVWFAAAVTAGALGVVNEPGRPPLVLLTFFLVPIAGFLTAYLTSGSFRAFTETIPLSLLVGSHLWRFVGIVFVVGWLERTLAAGFGIPAGFGDIIVALGALLLLPRIRNGTATRGWLMAWNVFGILDLVAAITLGLLYSESALGRLSSTTSNTRLLTAFPLSVIPTFFVPLFILMHGLLFKRIGRMQPTGPALASSAA